METPKNFALQLGSLISLYVTIISLNVLLFAVITISFPDAADSYWVYENAASSIRFSIATLLVFFPAYVSLTRIVNQMRRNSDSLYLSLTKWLIYLSLLVGGGVLLGDFVAVIYNWLEGDITIRFLLKAGVLALTLGYAIYYYMRDAQGYWQEHEKQSLQTGAIATLIVIVVLTMGFLNTETPKEVRDMKIDDNQINDLQSIQWQIEQYYSVKKVLPATIQEAYTDSSSIQANPNIIPAAAEERIPYVYNVLSENSYELCANFAFDSEQSEYSRNIAVPLSEKNYNWTHGAGEWCFERVVLRTQ